MEINLNGHTWVKEGDFKEKTNELTLNSLLLQAKNSLRIELKGQPGQTLTLTLVEGGEAGAILRPRQNQGHPTQESHVKNNDINFFDPNDPNSLGGLDPQDGGLLGSGIVSNITGVSVDGEAPIMFEAGTLVLRLERAEEILPVWAERYGAEVKYKSEIPGEPDLTSYYLQFDLSKSPVAELSTLIRAYREEIPAIFNDFSFASLSALQTFAILLDILVNDGEHITAWDLNIYAEEPALDLPQVNSNDTANLPAGRPPSPNNGWWLRDTFVQEAWNLSIGAGVKVAYIDSGFKNLIQGANVHPEMEPHRVIVDDPVFQNMALLLHPQDVLPVANNPLSCTENTRIPGTQTYRTARCGPSPPNEGTHGVGTMMVGFAQRNNNVGTAGVAPAAMVKPFNRDRFLSGNNAAITEVAGEIYSDKLSGRKTIEVVGFNMQ